MERPVITCGLCGRKGVQGFTQDPKGEAGLVCSNKKACTRRQHQQEGS